MKNRAPVFTSLCVVILFVFAAFLTWYIPSQASVLSGIEETKRSLETSRGREGKQQDEYDKAVQDLPVIQAELREKKPLVEEAEKNVAFPVCDRHCCTTVCNAHPGTKLFP